MRKKWAMANWKMNMTPTEARAYMTKMVPRLKSKDTEVVFFVPSIDIEAVVSETSGSNILVGAENFYYEDKGAYTGEISIDMIKDAGCKYVLIGHSERRNIFNENDDLIHKKLLKAIEKDIGIVLCVGESLSQRENGDTFTFIESQLKSAFDNIDKNQLKNIIIAYEPIWAIGTGKTATDDQAEEVCAYIRSIIKKLYDNDAADNMNILYGGSVNANNAKNLFDMPNIDGGLVGGASLKEEFENIVKRD